MGKYINEINGKPLPSNGKDIFILQAVPGSKVLRTPPAIWTDDLVCVVDNGAWEAAAYAYSPDEMEVFKYPDGRQRVWLTVPNAKSYAK